MHGAYYALRDNRLIVHIVTEDHGEPIEALEALLGARLDNLSDYDIRVLKRRGLLEPDRIGYRHDQPLVFEASFPLGDQL